MSISSAFLTRSLVTIKKNASSQEKIKPPHALFFRVMRLLLTLKKKFAYALMENR
jgi:hypothetical protein